MKTVIFWDVGGTILNRKQSIQQFVGKCLVRAGIDPRLISAASMQQAAKEFYQNEPRWQNIDDELGGYEFIAEILTKNTSASEEQIKKLIEYLFNYYDSYQVIIGIPKLLADVADRGVRQAILSNWMPSLPLLLQYHKLDSFFETVVFSGEVGAQKPDKRIFTAALERVGIGAEKAIYIGNDPEQDIVPAQELGITTILFDPNKRYEISTIHDVKSLRSALNSALK